MAKLKIDDLRNMTDVELEQNAASLKEEMYKLNCERRSGRIEKPHRISQVKKTLARIFTLLREKQNGRK